jgi:hypothetical protein
VACASRPDCANKEGRKEGRKEGGKGAFVADAHGKQEEEEGESRDNRVRRRRGWVGG